MAGNAAPFSLRCPGVRSNDFRITTFATNLSYPLGMARLTDGSLLVGVSEGASFDSSVGKIVRLVDADRDGVADSPGAARGIKVVVLIGIFKLLKTFPNGAFCERGDP